MPDKISPHPKKSPWWGVKKTPPLFGGLLFLTAGGWRKKRSRMELSRWDNEASRSEL